MDQRIVTDGSFDPIAIFPATIAALMEKGSDALALYVTYALSARESGDGETRMTVSEAHEALSMSLDRVRKAKSEISELGLMKEFQKKDEGGKIVGNYIMLSQIHTSQIPEGGNSRVWKTGSVDENDRIYSTRTHTYVPARNRNNYNNDNSYDNVNIIREDNTLCKEGPGEKLSSSYPEEKETPQTTLDGSTRADALMDPADPNYDWRKDVARMERGIDVFIEYWNKNTGKKFRRTSDFVTIYKSVWKKYGPDQMSEGCEKYFKYVKENADWLKHRFSPYDFLKQSNGFVKYLNNA